MVFVRLLVAASILPALLLFGRWYAGWLCTIGHGGGRRLRRRIASVVVVDDEALVQVLVHDPLTRSRSTLWLHLAADDAGLVAAERCCAARSAVQLYPGRRGGLDLEVDGAVVTASELATQVEPPV